MTGDENVDTIAHATKITLPDNTTVALPVFPKKAQCTQTYQIGDTIDTIHEFDTPHRAALLLQYPVTAKNKAANVHTALSADTATVEQNGAVFTAKVALAIGQPLSLHSGITVKSATRYSINTASLPPQPLSGPHTPAYTVAPKILTNLPNATNTLLPYFWPFWATNTLPPPAGWLHNGYSTLVSLPQNPAVGAVYPPRRGIAAISSDPSTFSTQHNNMSLKIERL